jgi:hydroxymethylpyrimidine pyrophosphatase-like HAD family hydrolase
MKVLAIALDFDGTIAKDDRLDDHVREAIAKVREQNIFVIIVTGRILAELREVAGDLHFVDAVVGENGAVLEFTDSGYSKVLGSPPPSELLEALRLEGIPLKVGQSVVETDTRYAPQVLAILQRLELPLALLFNKGRVMILGQAISKATGLHEALKILRLSAHNVIGIGDAENDHELLQACEIGVAVEWGSAALKARADYVLPGTGPSAVGDYILTAIHNNGVLSPKRTRRNLFLGYTDLGAPFSLAVRGRNVLITGDTKSGKSWITGLLCEQLILYGYSLLIVDPEGDYTSLEALPGVMVFGGADPLPRPRDLLRALRHADVSIVVDLSRIPLDEKIEYVRNLLVGTTMLRRHTGLPHRIIIDEAHYFLNDGTTEGSVRLDLDSYTLATYRVCDLDRAIVAAAEAILVTRESSLAEIAELRSLCASCVGITDTDSWVKMLGDLVVGEAVALPLTEEAGGNAVRIHLAPRLTPHVRHVSKYLDIPVSERNQFVFWKGGTITSDKARTLRQFVTILERWSDADLRGHLQRGDFSRWIANVFGDYPLSKTAQMIESNYCSGKLNDPGRSLIEAIVSRYEFVDPLA